MRFSVGMETPLLTSGFIIRDCNFYVAARPGYDRATGRYNGHFAGQQIKGNTQGRHSAPELTPARSEALVFKSHRAAARIASLCPSSVISAL